MYLFIFNSHCCKGQFVREYVEGKGVESPARKIKIYL